MMNTNILTRKALVAKTGINYSTILNWVKREGFPPPVRVGRAVLWDEVVVDNWFVSRELQGLRTRPQRYTVRPGARQRKPKPRIFKDNGTWAIRASDNLVFRSSSPQLVYKQWKQWSHA